MAATRWKKLRKKLSNGEELFYLTVDCCTMIVFGGTGDLAHRKLAPALYNMHLEGLLPDQFQMIGLGRKEKSDNQYRKELAASVEEYSASSWDAGRWAELENRLYYQAGDLRDNQTYETLRDKADHINIESSDDYNILYYLAVAPQYFPLAASKLKRHQRTPRGGGWRRIMIEKPFGYDLKTASELNSNLTAAFKEDSIYRVDHYLGKEMLQNILTIRFANSLFEPLWNNRFIDSVQISALEKEGIGDRGRYYDRAGAMRDMFQSHLLQMLAVTAMEPPLVKSVEAIKDEKLMLLKAVNPGSMDNGNGGIVLGQYGGYLEEKDIRSRSLTETYAAVKLEIDNDRWRGVPFYLRTGKKLHDKLAKIVIQFKKPPDIYDGELGEKLKQAEGTLENLLTLKIQPSEGVVFQFNIKKPGTVDQIAPAAMDFCQPCAYAINTPEAYEYLLTDAMKGDPARFTTWSEIEAAWKLTDGLYSHFKDTRGQVHLYEQGSRGPAEAEQMLEKDGRRWWES